MVCIFKLHESVFGVFDRIEYLASCWIPDNGVFLGSNDDKGCSCFLNTLLRECLFIAEQHNGADLRISNHLRVLAKIGVLLSHLFVVGSWGVILDERMVQLEGIQKLENVFELAQGVLLMLEVGSHKRDACEELREPHTHVEWKQPAKTFAKKEERHSLEIDLVLLDSLAYEEVQITIHCVLALKKTAQTTTVAETSLIHSEGFVSALSEHL